MATAQWVPLQSLECVPGLCLGFSLTHQVTMGKSLGFLAPLSPAIKFLWFALPTNPLVAALLGKQQALNKEEWGACYGRRRAGLLT